MSEEIYSEWSMLELMGHRRLFGLVTERQIAGAGFIHIKVPAGLTDEEGWEMEQNYGPTAVYCITPIEENLARQMATKYKPEPITRWDLPRPALEASTVTMDDDLPFEEELAELDEEEETCQCQYCVCAMDAPEGGKCVDCINGVHQG